MKRKIEQLLDICAQSLRQDDQCFCVQPVLLGLPGGHRLPGYMEPLRQLFLGQSCALARPLQFRPIILLHLTYFLIPSYQEEAYLSRNVPLRSAFCGEISQEKGKNPPKYLFC